MMSGLAISVALVTDDVSGFGVADDVAIPFILARAAL